MIFISAGHHRKDSGATFGGRKENLETIVLREKITHFLDKKYPQFKYIKDSDDETLAQYLGRIKTGSGSVVLEVHFDASSNSNSTGTTAIVRNAPTNESLSFATELSKITSQELKIRNRGVITESQSARGRLGLMRKEGIVSLLEVCFITNANDMNQYDIGQCRLAEKIADLLVKYEDKQK